MTSNYYPSCCKNVSRFPYVDRVSVGKNNDVNFIYQFVKDCTEYDESFVYNPLYLIGPPKKFPDYGDLPEIFCMESRDLDISVSPWQDKFLSPNYKVIMNKQHIDIVFHEAVYPIRVSIYETYNPGVIIGIYAKDSDNQWRLLWDGSRQTVPPTSRLFSPPLRLQSCNFKTKSLRLEFKPSTWNYCTELDAVMLIGTSKLILPRNSEESLNNLLRKINFAYLPYENEDVHNLTTDYKNAHLDMVHLQENFHEYSIIRKRLGKSDLGKTFSEYNLDYEKVFWEIILDNMQCLERTYCSHSFPLKSNLNSAKRMKHSSDKSVKLPRCNFSSFPDEVILKVLKNLDLKSLCRMSQVNKRLNNLTHDWSLYIRLNVRNVVEYGRLKPMYNIFCYFTSRCKYLQQLDLTGCKFSSGDFEHFLDNCGRYLTHLRLSRSLSVYNITLLKISEICKNLKKLDLRFCDNINNKGYSYLKNLEHLEHLSISYTLRYPKVIQAQTFCKILQKNQQMRELSLDLGSVEIGMLGYLRKIRNLQEINLNYPFYLLTSQSINALADCKDLRKITIRPFSYARILDDSLKRLFSSCQGLEEVYLYRCLTDDNLNSLTQCKNLKKLYLYDMKHVMFDLNYSIIFEQCPKLQELYFIYCNITKDLIKQWRETYPHVSVFVKTETYLHYQTGQHISSSS